MYEHLTTKELKTDLKRVEQEHKKGDFMSKEIENIGIELKKRNKEARKKIKGSE